MLHILPTSLLCDLPYSYKMIDVSQWRASIGLWNYCQAASSRPANGRHSHKKYTKSIQEEKRCTLPAVLFIIGFIVFYFYVLLLKHNSIPPPGKSIAILHKYIIHCMYH